MDKPKRILIVDDEELNRELLEDLIASFGHGPEMAWDGVEARAKLKLDRRFNKLSYQREYTCW